MNYITEPDRIYATGPGGKIIAEVTFPTRNGVASINHTYVDSSLRGQGIAAELVKRAADKIISDGHKIMPTCSYAIAWFKRHPQYQTASSTQI